MTLTLLIDYRDYFYSSYLRKYAGMDLQKLKEHFAPHGIDVDVRHFSDIDFRNENYANRPILYQSSEDRHLYYKDYIEDILLGLQLQGAILVPDFYKFRAHHNKSFQEILRDLSRLGSVKNISSRSSGTIEEFERNLMKIHGPVVVKPSEGAGSFDVSLFEHPEDARSHIRKISKSSGRIGYAKYLVKRHILKNINNASFFRKKFITQDFVPNLENDYKILVYGTKHDVLYRRNREHDFRASGSGKFEYRKNIPGGLLDFASEVFRSFDCPYVSLDIGYDGKDFYLLEFQFVSFGNLTLEKSEFHFVANDGSWKVIDGRSDLEKEVAESVARYLKTKQIS